MNNILDTIKQMTKDKDSEELREFIYDILEDIENSFGQEEIESIEAFLNNY